MIGKTELLRYWARVLRIAEGGAPLQRLPPVAETGRPTMGTPEIAGADALPAARVYRPPTGCTNTGCQLAQRNQTRAYLRRVPRAQWPHRRYLWSPLLT